MLGWSGGEKLKAAVNVNGSSMSMSGELLAHWLAPNYAQFTSAEIPDFSEQHKSSENWLKVYLMSSVFNGNFPGKMRAWAHNLLYRISNCLRDYQRARTLTFAHLAKDGATSRPNSVFFEALSAWEASMLNYQIALDIFRHSNGGEGAFQQNDESSEFRAYELANFIKHYADTITKSPDVRFENVLVRDPESDQAILPMWLTNEGFESSKHKLSFSEYAENIKSFAELCEKLSKPSEMLEEFRQRRATHVENSGL